MKIAGHDAVVMKKDGLCTLSVALTVFDVVWVFFEDVPDNWGPAVTQLTRIVTMPLKQMRDEYDQSRLST